MAKLPRVNTKQDAEAVFQRRLRIKLAVAAYAYEYKDDSIMSDGQFDEMCKQVDLSVTTGYRKLDNYFKKYFNPDTGMWVRAHPDKRGEKTIYIRYHKNDRPTK